MHPLAILQLFASVLAVMIAVALVAADSRQRANRLVAAALLCSAWWSLCEVFWSLSDDPREVVQWIKLSSLGWMWLGPLTLHIVSELVGDANTGLRRALPWAYASAIASIALYTAHALVSGRAGAHELRLAGPLRPALPARLPADGGVRGPRDPALVQPVPADGLAGRAKGGALALRGHPGPAGGRHHSRTCCCPGSRSMRRGWAA